MLTNYAGEFLVSPVPLELSMNYCSHKCAYCFANLNNPERAFDFDGFVRHIKNYKTRNDLTSYFLQNKYPVLISNKVDPFAQTNYRQTIAVLEILKANEIPVVWQTKGGIGIAEALDISPDPACWYISISMLDEDIRKKIEPGAPSIEDRFILIEHLVSIGHSVNVGVNPLVEDWLPLADLEKLCERLKSLGVNGVWIEALHLNNRQIANLTKKERTAIGEEIIRSSNPLRFGSAENYIMFACEVVKDSGLQVFSKQQPFRSDYFAKYHELYHGKTFKTMQDFINWCFENKPNKSEVTLSEFINFMDISFVNDEYQAVDGYLYTVARNIHKMYCEATGRKRVSSFRELLSVYWQAFDNSKSPFYNMLFQRAVDKKGNEILCDKGFPIAIFNHEPKQNAIFTIERR